MNGLFSIADCYDPNVNLKALGEIHGVNTGLHSFSYCLAAAVLRIDLKRVRRQKEIETLNREPFRLPHLSYLIIVFCFFEILYLFSMNAGISAERTQPQQKELFRPC